MTDNHIPSPIPKKSGEILFSQKWEWVTMVGKFTVKTEDLPEYSWNDVNLLLEEITQGMYGEGMINIEMFW